MDERPECGTYAAYQGHIRRGEPTDPACKAACADYHRNRRHARAAVKDKRPYPVTVNPDTPHHIDGFIGLALARAFRESA